MEMSTPGDFDEQFEQLYYKYSPAVFKNILKFVKDTHKAEDLLQEVFMLFHQKLPTLSTQYNIEGWLFVVSYHKALKLLKYELKNSLKFVDDIIVLDSAADSDTDEEQLYMDQTRVLAEVVELLSARKKQVFKLIKFEHYSVEETAKLMGVSPSTVTGYLSQAMYDIKSLIERKGLSHSLPAVIALLASIQP